MIFPLPRNRMNLSVAGLAYVLLTFWQRKDGDCKAFGREFGRKDRHLAVKQRIFAFGTRFDHTKVSAAALKEKRPLALKEKTINVSQAWLTQ